MAVKTHANSSFYFLGDGYTLKSIFPITATGELRSETFPTILDGSEILHQLIAALSIFIPSYTVFNIMYRVSTTV